MRFVTNIGLLKVVISAGFAFYKHLDFYKVSVTNNICVSRTRLLGQIFLSAQQKVKLPRLHFGVILMTNYWCLYIRLIFIFIICWLCY
jgi:hypothetical protein